MAFEMENEIFSQSEIIEKLINKHIVNYCVTLNVPTNIKKITIIASGSSYNAGLYGKYFFENIAKIETSVKYASEEANSTFDNYDKDSAYLFISQSGNSTDTVMAAQKVKKAGALVLSVTNNDASKLYETSDYSYLMDAGEENAIAATKTFTTSVVMLWIIALKIAQNNHINVTEELKGISNVKQKIDDMIDNLSNVDMAAKLLSKQKSFSISGLGYNFPLACESALKIKETCYINTSAYPLGEFIHGHFAILNESKVFLTFLTHDASASEISLLKKVLSTYKTNSIIISDEYEDYDCDILVKFNQANSKLLTIIYMIITIQILALSVAKTLNRNPDSPNGLVKVVSLKG